MSTEVLEAPVKQQRFDMPPVQVGDQVVWYPDGDATAGPSAARVIYASYGSVDLLVDGRDVLMRKRGVHHVGDPQIKRSPDIRRNGGWDYSVQHQRIVELTERVAALESLGGMNGTGLTDIRYASSEPGKVFENKPPPTPDQIKGVFSDGKAFRKVHVAKVLGCAEELLDGVLTEENGFVAGERGWFTIACK